MIWFNRPRSAQSAVDAHRRYSSSCAAVSPEKHALTDPEALPSDPDDDDDDERELVRGTQSQIEGSRLRILHVMQLSQLWLYLFLSAVYDDSFLIEHPRYQTPSLNM